MQPKTKEVLTLKANGLSSKQVCAKLSLHRRTVEWHLSQACNELGASNTVHAVALAMKNGLILGGEIGCIILLCWSAFSGSVDLRRAPTARNITRTAMREFIV
ncbi:hypothetical protein MAELSTROM_5 [Pseudoalteromonas phage Maelstrom]|uniref:hypothetical protein n=1 Tax=Pseudoalteromonas phage Maelstrom TaxID=2065202 RepID=UPI000CA3A094|nr:hypothetical protein PP584_gp05 [Pseudoalteromonas phage Maelstrom]AUG84925.1 hypothetical protein MAELSTROM_5 [Pseudoalteromonas phage Maelstrom]